jgi:adenylyl- and sulfurtransferase ThiI
MGYSFFQRGLSVTPLHIHTPPKKKKKKHQTKETKNGMIDLE